VQEFQETLRTQRFTALFSDGEEAGGLNGAGGSYRKGMAGGGKKMGGTREQTQAGGDFWDF